MTNDRLDVVSLGNAIVDVLANEDDAFLAQHDLVKGSMQLVDADRAGAIYNDMGPAVEASGGSAANTAAGVASLGGTAGFIGKVRDDQLGAVYTHDLRAAGVEFTVAPAESGPATAQSFIIITPDAERTMNTFLGASTDLAPDDVDPALIARASVVYLEGYLWDPPVAKDAFRQAMALAKEAGARVALTLSDSFCVDRFRDEFVGLLGDSVDVLFANEGEILSLFQIDDLDAALAIASETCEIVTVTRSELGSVVVAKGERHDVPAHPIGPLVDTTGAGDLYAAGFLFGLTHGYDLERCARLGNLCAGECISHIGPRPAVSLADLAARELA
ncbi:MAG TPA: adenosine kinase [Acidimicrobiales bacterium]|nr:adenosine kinase [Acidimicrobiales bacterium]